MNNPIYFIGWNKRIELTRKGDTLLYTERNPDKSVIRLKCDLREKRMVLEKRERKKDAFTATDELNIVRGTVVDLNDNGERWEGDLLNTLPFGYGCLYTSENEFIYKGFMYEGMKVCFGEEFQDAMVHYSGYYYKNQRHGYGKLYDQKGKLVYEGNWAFGRNGDFIPVLSNGGDEYPIHNLVERITIENEYNCDLEELKVVDYPALKSFRIGNECFEGVDHFEISNCEELETVSIGRCCFLFKLNKEKLKGCFLIHDCGHLKEVTIGDYSFVVYRKCFELRSMVLWY